ncbi:FtsK/SpoIIIE domain-containing protein [Cryobacterium melibiosiphilum]|uniref:FtsK/SpoIIIE domain-containing protein n=1 Tax=Cryobacterium melibiosiphilum TaxID=995039 RepID=UPI00366BF575
MRNATGTVADVLVTADVTATVNDVARHLGGGSGPRGTDTESSAELTLRVEYPGRSQARLLNPSAAVHESNLRSGCTVEVVGAGERRTGDDFFGDAAAIVRVLEGPDAGSEFTLASGVNYVGSEPDFQVQLTDPQVSRRHAVITVGETISVTDLNSANGVTVDGVLFHRSLVSATARIRLGETVLVIVPLAAPGGGGGRAAEAEATDFSRSPRVDPVYAGRTFTAPELPTPPDKARFPVLAVISPIILGAVLFFVTGQAYMLIFIALSPLIMLGTWIDSRIQNRRKSRDDTARFDAAITDLEETLVTERTLEVTARVNESPSATQVSAAMSEHSALLWTRKPEHASFLEVRLGLGTLPSRNTVTLPSKNSGSVAEWHQVNGIVDRFTPVSDVPVIENLARSGALGIAGTSPVALDAARSVLTQLAGLHSPADLVVTAFAGGDSTADWSWLKWMPHVNSAYSPLRLNGLASDYNAATALLAALEGLIAARRTAGLGAGEKVRSRLKADTADSIDRGQAVERLPASPAIVVLVTAEAPADRSRLVALGDEGADYGVFLVWLAHSVTALPVVCRTYLDVDPDAGRVQVGFVRSGRTVDLTELDRVDAGAAATAARALAPVEDIGARVLDESDLPRSVNFLDLYDGNVADDTGAVIRRWVKNDSLTGGWVPGSQREAGGIRALVGQGASEPFYLDLRAHGPHALVGGTTGSGKSEFLQTWIMGMAAEYAPDRVTFLLVDYKGGAAFAECVDLPHTVGLVTDLNPHLVRRALLSLRAELKYRETLLNAKGAKDLETLEKRSDPDAPPVLIIVIDEFAALAGEVPEFVDGVVDVAQRGRSLGLHLVLATQRPAGVIKDSLRANTNLRVALRVADEADSLDVLGIPAAAGFDPGTPGRAAAKLGPGRVLDFQAAYLGGHTDGAVTAPEVDVQDLPFGPGAEWATDAARGPRGAGARDIERLATTIARAADARSVQVPRKPWLDQLPELFDLGGLPAAGERLIPIGLLDEPEHQSQTPFLLDLDTVGNLAIIGTGGSGKTSALRTIAVAASAVAGEYPLLVYGLDFAGGGLGMLESLPTVASIVSGDDVERVTRLFKDLAAVIDDRAARFAARRAGSLGDYRALSGLPEPRILVLIDGMGVFRSEFEFAGAGDVFDRFARLAATGRQVGVHFVMTADRAGAFPTPLLANVGQRLVLRLSGESEYASAGVKADVLAEAAPGRALVGGHELQLAVAAGSADVARQSLRVDQLAAALRAAGVATANGIARLAEHISLADLPGTVDGRPTLGVSDDTLQATGLPLDGLFVVTGPFGSGRTTTMTTIVQSVRAARREVQPYLLVGRRSALATVTDWADRSTDAEEADALAMRLAALIESGDAEQLLIVIENVGDFEGLAAEGAVAKLIKAARRAGVPVIAETDTVTAASAWQIYSELKTARAGIVLQPEETDGLSLFRTPFPRVTRSDFPPGRGILVDSGRVTRVQVAFPTP